MIFMGDSSAYHSQWNYDGIDTNGDRLHQIVDTHDLFLYNFDTKTRVIDNGESNINLVLSSQEIIGCAEVDALIEALGSDHDPLLINLNFSR